MTIPDCTTKTCTKCGETFPATLEYFSPSKLGKYGLRSECKPCNTRIAALARQAKGAKPLPKRRKDGMRQCSNCEQWLPETDEYFRRRGDGAHRLRSWCRECLRADGREYQHERRKNPDVKEAEREYDKARKATPEYKQRARELAVIRMQIPEVRAARRLYSHQYERTTERRLKRRVRSARSRAIRLAAPGHYTKADVEQMFRLQKGRCWYCGCKLTGKYEIDHRIPISRGGTNWPNNLCIACFACNRSKRNKLPHEWGDRLL